MAEDNSPPTTFDDRVVFNERTHCKKALVVRENLHVKEKSILNDVVVKGDVTLKTGKELHECLDEVSTFVTDHKDKIEAMLSESSEALDSFKEVVDFLNSGDANLQSAIDTNVTKLSEVVTTLEGKHPTIDADNLLDNAFVDGFATLKGRVDTLLEGVTDETLDQVKEIADFISKDETGLKDLIEVNKDTLLDLSGNHYALDATVLDLSSNHATLRDEFDDLTIRHNALDTIVEDLSVNHATLDESVTTLDTTLTDLSSNHATLNESVTALDTTLTDLSGNHYALDELLADLSGNHYVLETTVTGLLTSDASASFSEVNTGSTQFMEHSIKETGGVADETFTIDYDNVDITGNLDVCGNLTVDGGIAMSGDVSIFGADTSFNVVCDEILLDAGQIDMTGNLDVCGNLTVDGGIAMSGDVSIFGADTSFNVVCDEILLDASTVDICGNLTVNGTVSTTSITDGTATLTGGNLSSVGTIGSGSITSSGTVTATSFTDGSATLSSGGLSGLTTALSVDQGGTGATTESTARTNLGLVIGTHVQAHNALLDDIAGLTPTNGGIIVGDGSTFVLESGATARTSLGLGSLSDLTDGVMDIALDASDVDICGNLTVTGYISADSVTDGMATLSSGDLSGLTGLTVDGNVTITDGSNNFDVASHDGINGLTLGGTLVQSSATELNTLNSVTGGTVTPSKAVVVDSNKNIENFNNLTATTLTGTLQTGAQSNITSVGTLTGLTVNGDVTLMSGDFSIFGADNSFNVVCDEILLDASTVDVCGNITVGGNLTVDGGIAMSGDFSIFGADTSFNVVCDEIMLDAREVDITGNLDICGNVTVSGSVAVLADAPASSTSSGTIGEIRVDDIYIYVCTATNTWKRVTLEDWT